MSTKRGILFVIPALAVIAVLLLLWTQETVLAAEQTYTFDDEASYTKLREALNYQSNVDAGAVTFSDDTHTITIDFEKVYVFTLSSWDGVNLSEQAQDFINSLFLNSQKLRSITLDNVALGKIDLSNLNGKTGLTQLTVTECRLESVPNIELPGLTYLNMSENKFSANDACASLKKDNFPSLKNLILSDCELTSVPNIELEITSLVLSKNNFSASGACNNLDSTHFSKLSSVYLDSCQISDVGFLSGLSSGLTGLSLGTNSLTNDSLDVLISMKDKLSNLQRLELGCRVWLGTSTSISGGGYNSNKITDTGKLASLFMEFPALTSLDVSGLGITSLQDFSYVNNLARTVILSADYNKITDFAGLENPSGKSIYLYHQSITLPEKFNPGEEYEIPDLLQRILDPNDALKGTSLNYLNCSLSDDGTKLVIKPNVGGAYVTVDGGKLDGSKIEFSLRRIPSYTIPQGLTATVGDTLAKVTLPSGFTWKDATMNVGAEGTNTFEAVYTPQDTDLYATVSVNIPVKVTDPNKPTEPTEPATKPTEPESPAEPTEPATKPTEPESPAEPTEPATEPTNPAEPTEPVTDPTNPIEPTSPVEPTEPATEPTKPVEPTAESSEEYEDADEDETEAAAAAFAAKTSDTSPVVPVAVLLLVSGVVLCITVLDKKKTM